MKNLIVIILFFSSYYLSAQEIDKRRYENVLQQLNLKSSQINEQLVTEKKMPNQQNSFIVVIPVLIGKYEADGFTVQNTILITDEKGIIKNKFSDPTEYGSDAMMLQSFSIDTGLYNLNTKTRAFGISSYYRNGSQPNPSADSDISLYVTDGKSLKKVLSLYHIYNSGAEWDMKCAGEFYEERSLIIVDKAKTNGFANLKIKTESTETISKELKGECVEQKTSKISYKTLKFDKLAYK